MSYNPLEFNEQATGEGIIRTQFSNNILEYDITSADFVGGEFTSGLLTSYFAHLEDQKLDSTFPFTWRKLVEDFRDWNHNVNGAPIPTTDPYDLAVFQNLQDKIYDPQIDWPTSIVGWNFAAEGDFDVTDDQQNLIMDTLIGGILRSYKFNRDQDDLSYSFGDFVGYFKEASAVTVDVFNTLDNIGQGVPKDYEKLISTYLPELSTSEAKNLLIEYIQQSLLVSGAFNPSSFYDRFAHHIEGMYEANIDKLQLTESEIERRQIFVTIFDILLNLYRISQQTILRFQDQLEYFTNLQKEYSELMANVPLYKVNPGGYGDLEITDLKEQAQAFESNYGAAPMFYYILPQERGEDNQLINREDINSDDEGYILNSDTLVSTEYPPGSGSFIDLIPKEDVFAWVNLADTDSITRDFYKAVGSDIVPETLEVRDILFQPRGRSAVGAADDDDVIKATGDAAIRATTNEKLNQYIETARGKRSVVKDRAKEVENTFNQLNESLNKITSLMTAIVQQISTILQAIFR